MNRRTFGKTLAAIGTLITFSCFILGKPTKAKYIVLSTESSEPSWQVGDNFWVSPVPYETEIGDEFIVNFDNTVGKCIGFEYD